MNFFDLFAGIGGFRMGLEKVSLSKFRWEMPDTSPSTSTGYIHRNTKVHLFNIETGKSACSKYWQRPLFYDEVEYTGNDDCYCKKCLKKCKKLEGVEG